MQTKRIAAALAVGLTLVAVALGVTLSRSPLVVSRANPTLANGVIANTYDAAQACQGGEIVPAGTSAIRLTLTSDIGPRLGLRVLSGARVATAGVVGNGWTGGSVTVPVRPLAHTLTNARICFELGPGTDRVGIVGISTRPGVAARSKGGEALPGRFKIEYMRTGPNTWWSLAKAVARHMGLGHAPSGTWIAPFLFALMGAVIATASWLTVRELR
jgi:hypothetical protein